MDRKTTSEWLSKHTKTNNPMRDVQATSTERLLYHDGVVYDPARMTVVHHMVESDYNQNIYRARNGRFVVERTFRGFDERSSGVYVEMASFNVSLGLLLSALVLLGLKTTWPLLLLAPFFGLAVGLGSTVLTIPAFIGVVYALSRTGVLDERAVVEDYSDLPIWAEDGLSVLCAMKGYDHGRLRRRGGWFEWEGGLPSRMMLIEPGDDANGYILRQTPPAGRPIYRTVSKQAAEKHLLRNEQYELYRSVFGSLPYPEDDC